MPQLAAPVIGWLAAPLVGLLGEGAAIAVAGFAVKAVGYAAVSAGVSALTKKSGKSVAQERLAQGTSLALGESPREAALGLTCVGGSLLDVFNHGGQYGTGSVTMCIALADHALDGLQSIIVDGVAQPFNGNGVQPGFSGKLSIVFVNASAEGTPPPGIAQTASTWTAADRNIGVSHVWITYECDEKVFTQGHPRFQFVLRGLRIYDMRKDAAFGYTGPSPHIWGDRSTHEFTQNAALLRYAYTRGIYAEGHQGDPAHLLIGRGLSVEEAPPERIIAAANLCDEIVEGGGRRYQANGLIQSSDTFIAVEEMFAAAMAGVIVQREGGVEIEPGQAKAVVARITDADLVSGEPVTLIPFLGDSDGGRVNTVVPRFMSPAGWKDHSGPVRRDMADIVADGGPREMTLPLVLVTDSHQADACAEITRRMARLEKRGSIVLPPWLSSIEDADWIEWQSDAYLGGDTVRFRVERASLNAAWRNALELREIASSVFGVPDPVEDKSEPPPPVPVDALSIPGASAEAIQLPGETSILPAVRFRWDQPDAAVRAIRGEVRVLGETEASPTRFEGDQLAQGVGIATNGVAAGQTLQARLVPIGDPSRPVLPSVWFTVSTGDLVASDTALWGGFPPSRLAELQATLRETLEQLLGLANDRAAGVLAEQRERLAQVQDALARLMLLAQIDPVAGTAVVRGDVMLEGEGETLAQTFVLVRAATDAVSAAVALEQAARITGDEAEAAARFLGLVQAASSLAAADLAIRAWTDGRIASATAGLATAAEVTAAVAASSLALQSWTDGRIASAVAGLATTAAVAAAIAAANLTLRSEVTAEIASAVAGLATTAAVAAAIAAANLTLRSEVTAEISTAVAGLATTAAVAAAIAAANLTLRSEVTAEISTAVAGLVTAAQLSSAIASALIQSQLQVDAYAASAALTFAGMAAFNGLSSTVGIHGTAISGLQAINNIAQLELIAAAGGGVPARIGIRSAVGSSDIALDASRIWWGPGSYIDSATYQIRTLFGSNTRRVIALGAPFGPDNLWIWSGPNSVSFGSESFDNATGAAESDGDSYYGGRTLSGPFDTGLVSGAVTLSSSVWIDLAWVEKTVRGGSYLFWPRFDHQGSGPTDGEGLGGYEVGYRIVSINLSGGDGEVIDQSQTGQYGPGGSFGPVTFDVLQPSDFSTRPGTRTGRRRLVLQATLLNGSSATVSQRRLRGFYAV